MNRFFAVALIASLAACSSNGNLAMFVQGDLTDATAIANAYGDAPAAACLGDLSLAVAPSPNPAAEGLFSLVQRKREIKATITTGKCSPLVGELLVDAAHRVPFVGAVLP